MLAKTLATLGILSSGRTVVGIGVGGLRREFEGLQADFSRRGVYTDEGIAAMRELWTQDNPRFNGEFSRFSDVKFSPKPCQKPHPPIWIGGQSHAALLRVARLGDGWHPSNLSPAALFSGVEVLKVQLDYAGRSMSQITLSVRNELEVVYSSSSGQNRPMHGTPEQLLEIIDSYSNLGVSEMIFSVSTSDVDRINSVINSVMESFAADVMAQIRR